MARGSPPSATSSVSTSRAASRLTSLALTIVASAARLSGVTLLAAGSASEPIRSTSGGIQLDSSAGSSDQYRRVRRPSAPNVSERAGGSRTTPEKNVLSPWSR